MRRSTWLTCAPLSRLTRCPVALHAHHPQVDLAVSLYPGVVAAPLILGTLAGSGGKMITDGIRGGWGALPGTAEVSVPGFVWRSAALAAAGYWGASKATGLLTSQEAAALVITVLVRGRGRQTGVGAGLGV